jgi:hypothetical protein
MEGFLDRPQTVKEITFLDTLDFNLRPNGCLYLTSISAYIQDPTRKELYQEALVRIVDIIHDAFEFLRDPFSVKQASLGALLLIRPLLRAGADLLQLTVRGQSNSFEKENHTHATCARMRDLSSGETEAGRMGTEGASISTVFRTASTTSWILASFSSAPCAVSATFIALYSCERT